MPNKSNKSLRFILGFLSLGAGLFMIGQAVSVSTAWGGGFRVGGMTMPSGVVVIPLLIGIGMLFYNHQGKLWKYITAIGIIFILLSVILSVRITVNRTSLFDFIIMFSLTAAGTGMLLRYWFYDR